MSISLCHLVIVKHYCKNIPRVLSPDSLSVNKVSKFLMYETDFF